MKQPKVEWKLLGVEELRVDDIVLNGDQSILYHITKIRGCPCPCRNHFFGFRFFIKFLNPKGNTFDRWETDFRTYKETSTGNKRWVLRL